MWIGQTQVREEDLLKWGTRLAWASCTAVLLLFLMKLICLQNSNQKLAGASSRLDAKLSFSYQEIGKGSLSLNAARPSQFIPWLGSELLLLGCNTRPDNQRPESALLLGVKALGEERVVQVGENIFLAELEREKEGRKGVLFSKDPTSLSIKPLSLGKNSVTFEVRRTLPEEQVEEKTQLVLQVTGEALRRNFSIHEKSQAAFAKTVKEAKHWGKDRLLEIYGGEEYRPLKEREKIQFSKEDGSHVCFVKAGDLLIWENEKWKIAAAEEISSGCPIAQVKIATPRTVEIEVWDETGFYHHSQKLDAQSFPKQQGKEASLFSSIRLRNNSAVTCIAGKRRLVLREGDWLLKTPSGWRNLRSVQQIEDCIAHRLVGELFIFEGLEVVQGKTFVKGQLFDPMRTQIQQLSLPVAQDKKSSKGKERRSKR